MVTLISGATPPAPRCQPGALHIVDCSFWVDERWQGSVVILGSIPSLGRLGSILARSRKDRLSRTGMLPISRVVDSRYAGQRRLVSNSRVTRPQLEHKARRRTTQSGRRVSRVTIALANYSFGHLRSEEERRGRLDRVAELRGRDAPEIWSGTRPSLARGTSPTWGRATASQPETRRVHEFSSRAFCSACCEELMIPSSDLQP